MTTPIVEVEGLVKRYKGAKVNAVDGISFAVPPGSFFTLLGPNGAGKTTTISILTTTLAPTAGRVVIAGHDLVQDQTAVRREVGIIFQAPSIDLNLSAEENVRFHAILYGLYPFRPAWRLMPAAYRQDVQRLAAVVGLGDEIFRPIRTFSGGMRRKLEIVRSLIHRPRVLFLDEPSSGLDPQSRRSLWDYLAEMRRDTGTTVVLTTHYLDEAEDADLVCVMNKGQVVAQGTPRQLKDTLTQAWVELDAADRDGLAADLARLGAAAVALPEGGYRVDVEDDGVQRLVAGLEVPLTRLRTHTPSLEDAYLRIITPADEDGDSTGEPDDHAAPAA